MGWTTCLYRNGCKSHRWGLLLAPGQWTVGSTRRYSLEEVWETAPLDRCVFRWQLEDSTTYIFEGMLTFWETRGGHGVGPGPRFSRSKSCWKSSETLKTRQYAKKNPKMILHEMKETLKRAQSVLKWYIWALMILRSRGVIGRQPSLFESPHQAAAYELQHDVVLEP
jgi:hypothetical protein